MKLHLSLKVLIAVFLAVGSTSLVAETQILNKDDGNGRILQILGPDDLHLDPDAVVVAVDVFGDEDREINGVLFQSDKTDDNTIGKVERDGVTVDLTSTHFIDGWAAAPAFTGGQGSSADNLALVMEDIRWSQAPNPLTMDVSGLDGGGLYEIQILVNENGDRDRHWDIAVNDVLAVDDFTSEGTNEGPDVWTPENSFVYVGEFEANADGQLNILMQQHIGGQDQLGADNNPILQALIVHALNTSDDDPNVLTGSTSKFGQVSSTPATVKQVRIRNTGATKELVISKFEMTGADGAHFTILNDVPITIPPDTGVDGDPEPSVLIDVSFDPMGRTGAFVATLEITSNDQTEAVNVVQLSASVINRLGPVSHLPLDEAAGALEVRDVSGNDNGGVLLTPTGAVALGQDPGLASGTALKVSEGGELVIEAGSLDTLENFSISLWLQIDSFGGGPATVFAKGNVETPAFALLAIGGTLGWLPEAAGENPEFVVENALTEGTAHHVVVVHDNTSGARSVTIYVDGVATSIEDPIAITDDRGLALQFGSYNGALLLNGIFDDVQVYNRVIGAEEVAQLKDNPGSPLPIGDNAPIDSDGDGLVDSREAELGTDALKPDTDGDGLNDLAEVDVHGTNPLLADTDGDGFDDRIEILTESDPNDPNKTPIDGDTLAAYWNFDDASNDTMATATAGGQVGELMGDAAFSADGEGRTGQAGDRAMDFGVAEDSSALLADGTFLNDFSPVDQMTVTYWQKLRSVTNMTAFKARSPSSSGAERGWSVHTPWGDGTIYFDTAGCCDGATQRINQNAGGLDFLEWNHFAFTKNGATKQIWVNGELFHQGQNQSPLPTDFNEIWLGSSLDGAESFDGMMDDFAIFKIALPEEEIKRLAAGAKPGSEATDSDGDGWDDAVETAIFGDLSESPDSDKDGDGLSNDRELNETLTDVLLADTDGDTISDGDEVAGNPPTNPLLADTDADGLDDAAEMAAGTDPTKRDTDGDKFGDGFEVANNYDPLDPNSPGEQQGGPIIPRVEIGKLTSIDNLFIDGAFTHAVNIGGTIEDYQVGDINFARDTPGPDNIEFEAVNHIEDWGNANDFGAESNNSNLAGVVNDIRWSPAPESVIVTLKDVDRGAYRLQLLFGEKCCDRGFAVSVNGEVIQAGDTILDQFSPNALQEGDHSGVAGAYIIYEFNQSEAGDLVIDLNGTDAGFSDGNAILSGVSLQFLQSIDGGGESTIVSKWSFDGDLLDVSAGAVDDNLTPTGNPEYAPGIVGQAVKISANGLQRLRAEDSDDLDLAESWTLEAFVWPDADNAGEWDRFWTKWGDGGNQWHTAFRSTGAVDVENGLDLFINGGDNVINSNTTAEVPLEQWSHVAFVGDAAADTITAWLNGEQVGETAYQAVTPGDGAMNFGNFESPANGLQYSGLIDEAAIHAVAVNQAYLIGRTVLISGGNGVDPQPDPAPVVAIISGPDSIGLSFTGAAGKTYNIEYSEDLQTWSAVETGLQGEINFEDSDAARVGRGAGYYRAVEN